MAHLTKLEKFCRRKNKTGKKSVNLTGFLNCMKSSGKGKYLHGYAKPVTKRRRKSRR